MNTKRALILCCIFASLTTLFQYIDFGLEDQKSELPLVMRAIDPFYLTSDFYTNSASTFGPRYFYTKFIALILSKKSLPYFFFLLTLLTNMAIALVTFYFSRDLFSGSSAAGLLAVLLVMSIPTFNLGFFSHVYSRQLLSNTIVIPLVLGSLWAAFRNKPFLCALTAGAAVLLHPTFGAEAGLLAFFVLIVSAVLKRRESASLDWKKHALKIGGAMAVFILFVAVPLIPYLSSPRIETKQFLDIETQFRHPHHNFLSHLSEFDLALYFFLAVGIAWYMLSKKKSWPKHFSSVILSLFLFIILFCLAGLFFIEVFPSRLWAVARPFRLIFVLKWMGLIILGGHMADVYDRRQKGKAPWEAVCMAVSMLSPLTMAVSHVAMILKKKINRIRLMFENFVLSGILTGVFAAYLVLVWEPRWQVVLVYMLFILLYVFYVSQPITWLFYVGVAVVLFAFPVSFMNDAGPKITFTRMSGQMAQVASFARESTSATAVFLTPPDFGLFRLMAERAIVVNWRSFPFQEMAMIEWKKRMEECYGKTESVGHQARDDMIEHYRNIDDSRIRFLQSEYGISYCVLFKETQSGFPVLYENERFKIVSLLENSSLLSPDMNLKDEKTITGYSPGISNAPSLYPSRPCSFCRR